MSSKRYPPSAKKLKKAKENGDLLRSKDLTSSLILIVGSIYLYINRDSFIKILDLFNKNFTSSKDFSNDSMILSLAGAFNLLRELLIPLLVVIFITILVTEGLQVGFNFNFKHIFFKSSRFNLCSNLVKIFGGTEDDPFGVKILGMILKFSILVICFFILCALTVFFGVVEWVSSEPHNGVLEIVFVIGLSIFTVLIVSCSLAFFLAVVDYFIQKARRQKRLMMTADELKREFKESEGNPELKDSRRQLHQEVLQNRIIQGVRKAKVLISGKEKR